jgi:hypothetical protein
MQLAAVALELLGEGRLVGGGVHIGGEGRYASVTATGTKTHHGSSEFSNQWSPTAPR